MLHYIEVEDWDGHFYAEFEINFTYWPGEPMQRYCSDGSGYPGSPPEVEVNSVKVIHLESDALVIMSSANQGSLDGWEKDLNRLALDYVLKRHNELYDELITTAEAYTEEY